MNYQKLFDDVYSLLKKIPSNTLVEECLKSFEGEFAFTAADNNKPVAKSIVLDIYKRTDEATYNQIKTYFDASNSTEILIWYFDTEVGAFTIFTNTTCNEFLGIKKTHKTLLQVRREYFLQKEALQKIDEKPSFNYEEKEITFINKKLIS